MNERKLTQGLSMTKELYNYFPERHLSDFEKLPGGYTSDVFKGKLDGKLVIVKHARGREIFYPTYSVSAETRMATEIEVLRRLFPIFPKEVPQILEYYPENNVAVMTDVSSEAELGFPYLMSGQAEPRHGAAFGDFLARLKQATDDWKPFETVESGLEQISIRGQEVKAASPEWGKQLQDSYLDQQKFIWVDGHPKNVFFGEKSPLVRAIDWDCSHFADPDYMLPNFFGQIPIFTIFGHIGVEEGVEFTKKMINAYVRTEPVSPEVEKKMCFYAGCQTIQRQDGKWLFDACGGTDDLSLHRKAQLFYLGRKILTSVSTFDQYLELLKKEGKIS